MSLAIVPFVGEEGADTVMVRPDPSPSSPDPSPSSSDPSPSSPQSMSAPYKRPRTVSFDKDAKAATIRNDEEVGVIQGLPSIRQLAKFLCRIVDDDTYLHDRALKTLQQIQEWSSFKPATSVFFTNFADLGGARILLLFLEDHMADPQSVMYVLNAVDALTKNPTTSSAAVFDRNNKVMKAQQDIARRFANHGGVEVLLRTFAMHAPKEETAGRVSEGGSTIWAAFRNLSASFDTPGCLSMDNLILNACVSGKAGNDKKIARTEETIFPEEELQYKGVSGTEIAERALIVLAGIAPFASKVQHETILDAICKAIPVSLATATSDPDSPESKLAVSMMACLVVGSVVTFALSNSIHNGDATKRNADVKQILAVTVQMMNKHPNHPEINKNGCLVLQCLSRKVAKAELKRMGVVAVIGNIMASNSLPQSVKDIADGIFEEQMK